MSKKRVDSNKFIPFVVIIIIIIAGVLTMSSITGKSVYDSVSKEDRISKLRAAKPTAVSEKSIALKEKPKFEPKKKEVMTSTKPVSAKKAKLAAEQEKTKRVSKEKAADLRSFVAQRNTYADPTKAVTHFVCEHRGDEIVFKTERGIETTHLPRFKCVGKTLNEVSCSGELVQLLNGVPDFQSAIKETQTYCQKGCKNGMCLQ